MTQNARGFKTVTLDKERKLRFDFNSIADVEERLGAGIAKVFNEDNIGFNTIRALYWAGLKWQDKGLTMDRTGRILNKAINEGTTFKQLMNDMQEALEISGIISKKAMGVQNELDEDEVDLYDEDDLDFVDEEDEEKN